MFKAKAQRADIEDAEVVIESHDTEVERPLDLEEAEEVEEEKGEEFEGEGETAPDNEVLYEWIFSACIKQMLLSAQQFRSVVSKSTQWDKLRFKSPMV